MAERRKIGRRNFSYYMRLMNENTGELVGHLADISTSGFRMESLKPIPPNMDFRFRIELSIEVANYPFMVFGARSKWCQMDHIDKSIYNIGFQITDITPANLVIFSRMFERYGSEGNDKNKFDYLWK